MIDVSKCEYYHDNMLHIKGYCSCNFIKQCQCKEITDCVFKLKYLVRKLEKIKSLCEDTESIIQDYETSYDFAVDILKILEE